MQTKKEREKNSIAKIEPSSSRLIPYNPKNEFTKQKRLLICCTEFICPKCSIQPFFL